MLVKAVRIPVLRVGMEPPSAANETSFPARVNVDTASSGRSRWPPGNVILHRWRFIDEEAHAHLAQVRDAPTRSQVAPPQWGTSLGVVG